MSDDSANMLFADMTLFDKLIAKMAGVMSVQKPTNF